MHDTPATALLTLLTEERAAIRAGQLSDLTTLANRKDVLTLAVAATPPDRATTARIDRSLQHNARLLSAACDGIRAAQARLAAIKDVRSGLNLYTANGNRTTVARRPDSLEHKA